MTDEERELINAALEWAMPVPPSDYRINRLLAAAKAVREARAPKPRYQAIQFEFNTIVIDRNTGDTIATCSCVECAEMIARSLSAHAVSR